MNYEKKYKDTVNEVIKMASTLQKYEAISNDGYIMSNLRNIFPELRESEDEKIREELISYLHAVIKEVGELGHPKIDSWIAYLQKQNCSLKKGTNTDCTEYIRKDVLLEWLNNEVERYNDKLIQSSNNKEEAIQIASSISSLLRVIAKLETL